MATSITDIEKFAKQLDANYNVFNEETLKKRRIKHKDIVPLIEKATRNGKIKQLKLGESTEGRAIYLLKAGTGKINVLLWSQMHGDEPTATQAFFDIFNLINNKGVFEKEIEKILSNISLYFVPMLNPDGAELFERRNSVNIDLNRDASRLAADESIILKKLSDKIKPDVGFNLHDQNPYYAVGNTNKPATITLLSPAYNIQRDINENRKHSMRLIVLMNRVLQNFIPGQVGRYYFDDYSPTSVGDNLQKMGTSTILVESGECQNDTERQYVRKLNFIAILSAIKGVSDSVCKEIDYKEYMEMPAIKDAKLFHLLIRGASIEKAGKIYTIDIGIRLNELNNKDCSGFTIESKIHDIGDLSHFFGYEEIDAKGLKVSCKNQKSDNNNDFLLNIGDSADFVLTKNDKTEITIKNGRVLP